MSRANVLVKSGSSSDPGVYLYTHSGGRTLPLDVQNALKRQVRWDDPQYLARIIFCSMMLPGDFDEETGFGISAFVSDGGLIKVVAIERTISINGETWSFYDYLEIDLSPDNIANTLPGW